MPALPAPERAMRRLGVLALVTAGVALLATLDVYVAALPAFGLSALAAWRIST